jgi:hypothetical protein
MSGSVRHRTTNSTAERVTESGQLQLPGPAGSVPAKSTRIASPSIVTATRMPRSSSRTPSPSREADPSWRPSGRLASAARVRRSAYPINASSTSRTSSSP